jgi:hypothetical protein
MSINISYLMIFIGGVTNIIMKIIQKKDSNIPYIEFNILLISIPAISAGVYLG